MPQRYFFRVHLVVGLILLGVCSPSFASPSSPDLPEFMQRVWQDNPSIQAFEFALQAAKSRMEAADQPIHNPEVDVEVARTDVNALSVGVNQAIDWGNKRAASTSKANAEVKLAQAELQNKRLTVATEVLTALIQLQSVERRQSLARQRLALMEDFISDSNKRQHAGDIGSQDVALASVALSEAKMQFANTAAQYAKYLTQLQVATEIFITQWPVMEKEPPPLASLLVANAYLAKLPAINILKAKLLASRSNINLSKSEQKPDPSFGLRGGMEGEEVLVGINFSMPLFIRNNYRAEIEVANQEVLQIERLLLSATRRAEAQLSGSHKRYRITYDAWQLWKQTGLNSLNEQMKLINTLWKSGEMNTSEYLIQAKQNVDAQETAVELSSHMWEAWIEWLVASGQIEQWIKQTN